MRSSDNEVTVVRGETFCLRFRVVNKDGSPYVVPKIADPHLMLLLTDSMYEQNARFYERNFLPLTIPTFLMTTVVPMSKVTNGNGVPIQEDFSSVDVVSNVYLSGYYDGNLCDFEVGDCVHSAIVDGKIQYKYADVVDGELVWKDYDFDFVQTFLSTHTDDWPNSLYYSIYLVSGTNDYDYKVPILNKGKIFVLSD